MAVLIMSLRSVHHLKRRLHIVLTNSTTAKVSNPSKTRSTFSAATSASLAVNVVLKAHSTSPIPAHEPHCQNLWEQGRHWSLGRPTLHIPFVKTHKLHTSMSARCPFDDQDACLTGSGIFLCSSSSTCTVVGKLCTGSHSPSFTTSPPPTWVNVQPSCSSLDAVIGGGLSRCQDWGHGECERASFGVDTASASVSDADCIYCILGDGLKVAQGAGQVSWWWEESRGFPSCARSPHRSPSDVILDCAAPTAGLEQSRFVSSCRFVCRQWYASYNDLQVWAASATLRLQYVAGHRRGIGSRNPPLDNTVYTTLQRVMMIS